MPTYSSPACFLADCHLPLISSHAGEDRIPVVLEFLRSEAAKANSLFIVGDLFDFWFEWRHSVPSGAFPVLAELNNLKQQGLRILYIGGNHDGHVGKFLREQVGIETSRNPVSIDIDRKSFHLIHGDGLARGDYGYRALRSLVRWNPTESIFRLVHPDFGIWFAHLLSRGSRRHFSGKVIWSGDAYRDYARGVLDRGTNYVVMGHRHEAEWIAHPNGGFLAVGDWIGKRSYGWFENDHAELRYYK